MPYTLKEGEKRSIRTRADRLDGSGAITLTQPERRILDGNRNVVAGFDWGAATWDAATRVLSALFDSDAAGLTAVGTYWMQLRGTIGVERYAAEVKVTLEDLGA